MKRYFAILLAWGLLVSAFLSAGNKAAAQTFPANLTGSYGANLVLATSPTIPRGKIEFTVTANGAVGVVSGKLTLPSGKVQAFKITDMVADGTSGFKQRLTIIKSKIIPLPGPQGLELFNLRVAADGSVTGFTLSTLNSQDSVSIVGGIRFANFTGKPGSVAPWVGNYTMALTTADGSSAGSPAGAGYASLVVAANGAVKYTGKLGDGTKLTGSAKPNSDAVYSIFQPMYSTGGFLSLKMELDMRGLQSVDAIWNKPANAKDKIYKDGFSAILDVRVQPWIVPAKGAYPLVTSLGFGSSKNFTVTFSGEGLSDHSYTATLPDTLRITGLSAIQAVSGGTGSPTDNNNSAWNALWKVKLNAFTGVFTGTQVLTHVAAGKTVTRKIPIEGVLVLGSTLDAAPFAYGQYRVTPTTVGATEVSGLVKFLGPLVTNADVGTAGSYSAVAELAIPDDEDQLSDPKVGNSVTKPISNLPSGLPKLSYGVYPSPNANERKVLGTFPFSISEDLQTMIFNGRKLKLVSYTPIGTGLLVYNSVSASGSLTVDIGRDTATGAVNGLIAIYFQVSGVGVKNATFTASSLGGSSGTAAVTQVTKF